MWCACLRNIVGWLLMLGLVGCGGRPAGLALPLATSAEAPRAPLLADATASATPIPRRWDLTCPDHARLVGALTAAGVEPALAQAGMRVLCALRAARWDRVADFVHPRVGLRLALNAAQIATAPRFTATEIAHWGPTTPPLAWGPDPTTGHPLWLSPATYLARYGYDAPYWEEGRPHMTVLPAHSGPGWAGARVLVWQGPAERGGEPRTINLAFQPGAALPEGLPGTWCLIGLIPGPLAPAAGRP